MESNSNTGVWPNKETRPRAWLCPHEFIPGDGDLGQPECKHCGLLKSTIDNIAQELDKAREEGRQEGMMDGGAIKAAIDSVAINKISRQEERARIISLIDGMKEYDGKGMIYGELINDWNKALEAIKNKING